MVFLLQNPAGEIKADMTLRIIKAIDWAERSALLIPSIRNMILQKLGLSD